MDLKAAKLPTTYADRPIDFHATRRSFATWLGAAGVEEGAIKRLMGHAASGVTQRHYQANLLPVLHAAVCKIAFELPPQTSPKPPRTPL